MGVYYVSPNGNDNNNGTSWATAYATIDGYFNAHGSGGDTVYLSSLLAQSDTNTRNIVCDTGIAYISVDETSGTPPTVAKAGASITSGATTVLGSAGYFEGITFTGSGSTVMTLRSDRTKFRSCVFNPSTGITSFSIGNSTGSSRDIEMDECTVNFINGFYGFYLTYVTRLQMRGGAVNSSSNLSSLFTSGSGTGGSEFIFEGVDFTGMNCTQLVGSASGAMSIVFRRCKFNASFAGLLMTNSNGTRASQTKAQCIECDVAGSGYSYRFELAVQNGDLKATTGVYRTSGAKVGTGPSISWQFISRTPLNNDTLNVGTPARLPEFSVYNEAVGSPVNLTVEFLSSADNLTARDIWLELSYLSESTSMFGKTVSTEPTSWLFNSTTMLTKSSATWNNVPSGYIAYKISVTVTPQQVGLITAGIRIHPAKLLTTYVDPFITVA